jgi:DNA-binding NtrC family response regulator
MRAELEALVREMVEKGILYDDARREFEKRYIVHALELGEGNIGRAAEIIGLHRNTLSRKIAEYQIKRK